MAGKKTELKIEVFAEDLPKLRQDIRTMILEIDGKYYGDALKEMLFEAYGKVLEAMRNEERNGLTNPGH